MVDELSRRGIRFVLIGGLAAIAHGSAYNTNDLDICYDVADDNLAKLLDLLTSWDAYPRGWEAGLPWYFDLRTLKTTPLLTLRTREGDIDLLDSVAGVGDYHACLAVSDRIALGEQEIRVLNLDFLIKSKKTAGRKKDRERLIELEALRALREQAD
ncbi:MAG TPA: nucleotidyltransferase [Longimicrobium sp.]|nr:nucleotidyltransferase [Longimicrobium sp.]